jgi:HK97 family phage major capsid protein
MHALKVVTETDEAIVLGGYGVVFGGEDLEGETFTPTTDYMLDLVPVKPVYIDHSEDSFVTTDGKTVKLRGIHEPVGRVTEVTADDTGLYMELQIEKANRYWSIVEAMVRTGKAGLSSGTIGHLARREGKQITRWPLVEESITLTPAEPRTVGLERLKSLAALNPTLKALIPEAADTAEDEATDGEEAAAEDQDLGAEPAGEQESAGRIEFTEENDDMSGQDTTPGDAELRNEVKALSETVNKIMEVLEKAPALKSAGYTTDDGGAADPTHKSFGDFLLAVKRRDAKRLTTIYKARRDDGDTKDMAESTGAAGGYLVPTEYMTSLLQMATSQSQIYSRVQTVTVGRDAGEWPALDQFIAPSAGSGQTAMAGAVTAPAKAEGATLDETQPEFVNLEWRIHKIGGIVEVSNELIADSPTAIETLLRALFGIAIAAKNERNILRGSGVGEPLGILNAAAAIGVTPAANNTFGYADALAMRARFKMAGGSPVWLIHPGIWPDLGTFETTSGGGVWQANLAAGVPQNILGYPIIESEHLPQDDNAGSVILADLNAYILFERQQLSVAFSEHAAFKDDKGTWRFTSRNDGQPWVRSAITLADPQGAYTVSPFVYHND